jgi:hypothetical protein
MVEPVRNRENAKHPGCRVLIALEPAGISWLALSERLTGCGDAVCLGPWQAVCHHRQTLPEGIRKTETTDADRVVDLLSSNDPA